MGSGHGERGQTIVEFTVAATVALVILFGILEFGRALYDYHLVANAARIGSRYAIVNGSDSCTGGSCVVTQTQLQTYVRSYTAGIDTSQLTVTLAWNATNTCYTSPYQGNGCQAVVTASYPFQFVAFPYGTITMTSTSTMYVSQ